MYKRIICEDSLRWILNYRHTCKSRKPTHSLEKLADIDGHSGGSWIWTKSQSQQIDKIGWDNWFNKTKGPEGYGLYFNEYIDSCLRHRS